MGVGSADELGEMVRIVCARAALSPEALQWAAAGPSPAAAALVVSEGVRCAAGRSCLAQTPAHSPTQTPAPAPPPSAGLSVSSAQRGAMGEEEVARILGQRYSLSDTAKTDHSADFVIDSPAGPVLVEIKDYSSTVPRRELVKLQTDLQARGAAAAVFLSLASPIATVGESLAIRFESAGGPRVPVVYAAPPRAAGGRLSTDAILVAAEIAVGLAGAAATLRCDVRARSDVAGRLAGVRTLLDDLTGARTALLDATSAVNTALNQCAQRFAATESRLRAAVTDMLDELADEIAAVPADATVATLAARYSALGALQTRNDVPADFVGAVVARCLAATPASALDRSKEWRFLKTKAVHATGWGFSFARAGVAFLLPREFANACGASDSEYTAMLLKYPQHARFAGGVLEVALDGDTASAIAALVRA